MTKRKVVTPEPEVTLSEKDAALVVEAASLVNRGGFVAGELQLLLKRAENRVEVRNRIMKMKTPKKAPLKRVTAEEVVLWEADHKAGMSCREIAAKYKRGYSTIEKYVYGKPV